MAGPTALRLILILVVGIAASSSALLYAQPEVEYIDININPEGLTMDEAVEWASEATGKTFAYTENLFRGKKVMISGIARVRKDQVYEFWQAIFATQGFAMVSMGPEDGGFVNIEQIDQSRQLKQRATYVSVEDLAPMQRKVGEVVMTSIPLKYVAVGQVRQAVNNILANRNAEFVQEIQSANALIVVGFAPTVYAIYQILQAMDQPSTGLTLKFEILSLKYAVAEELLGIVSELISAQTGGSAGAPRPAIVRPGQGDAAMAAGWQEKPEPKIISDPRTNSLVVYAVDSDLAEVKRLIAALDTPVSEVDSNIRIYFLKNTNADDMETTLRDVLSQTATRSTRAGTTQGRGGVGPTTTNERGQEVNIVADTNTNALVITCSRTRYGEIEQLIMQLDKRRPQVLVQAAIAELSDDDLRSLASEITAIEGGNDRYRGAAATGFGLSAITTTVLTSDGGTGTGGTGTGTGGGTPGTAEEVVDGALSGLVRVPFLNSMGSGLSFQGLVAGILESNFGVPLLISLLETTTRGNLVSVPSVLTNDNEQSTIKISREVPTVSFQTTAAGTDQQSFSGYQEAKLELKISPHISNDNYLRLEIELMIEAFIGIADPASGVPPPRTSREFIGSVTVPNGRTVVIGGLVQDNYQEDTAKVPFLGDIPILGYLFKSEQVSRNRNTLYFFVTPTIFKDFQSLEEVSYQKKLEIEKLEGNIRLIDRHFRRVGIGDSKLSLEDIEDSGGLDIPRYSPLTPLGLTERVVDVDGIPVHPAVSADGTEATIEEGGTREIKLGSAGAQTTTRPQNK